MMMSSKIQVLADKKDYFCRWNTLPKVLVSKVCLMTFQLHTEKNAFLRQLAHFGERQQVILQTNDERN